MATRTNNRSTASTTAIQQAIADSKKVDLVNRETIEAAVKVGDIVETALKGAEERIPLPVTPPCVTLEPDQTSFFLKSSPDTFMFTVDNGYSVYSDKLAAGTLRPYIGTIFVVDTIKGRKLAKCPIGTVTLNSVSLNNDALAVEIFGKIGRKASALGAVFSREKFKKEIEDLVCYRAICEKQAAKAEATAKKEKINAAFKQLALGNDDLSKYY